MVELKKKKVLAYLIKFWNVLAHQMFILNIQFRKLVSQHIPLNRTPFHPPRAEGWI